MNRTFVRAAIAVATLTAFAVPALAHVSLEVTEARLGSTYKAILRVPHGCAGAATTTLRVQIPEGFFAVKPMPKPGWTISLTSGTYKNSYDNYGTAVTEGVKEIVWSGGQLPDAYYDEFVFRGTFAGSLLPGPFYFPTVQECGATEEPWIDTSGDENAELPAPSVELVPADAP